ncbi:hypothetical protein [Piscinibacter sp.]|jgi:hypothetical protein|uniref:hypothetical protein n=1 Tax=Piscinibacter sp. TaxID=1903157 RepID=UPI002F3F54A2
MKQLPRLPLLPLAACLGLIASTGAAHAEANPYYIGASQAFTRDSNVLRQAEGSESSDTVSTTSLLAGFDQPISRQRLYANGTLRHNRYSNLSQLNSNGYSLTGGIDWATVENLSGKLAVALNRNPAQYGSPDAPQLTTRNLETSRQASATAALGVVTKLTLEAGLTHRSLDYSAPEWLFRENKQDAANVGLRYAPSDLLKLGVGLRETRGEYPHPHNTDPDTPEHFRRHDLDLTGTWVASGASTLDGRLSFGRQRYDAFTARNFSGATGLLEWRWKPTGKLSLNTLLTRDTGNEASFTSYLNGALTQAGDSSRLTNLLRIQGNYEMTAKIQLTATASNAHRSLVNSFDFGVLGSGSESGTDTTTQAALGLRYAPTRNILLGCDVSRESRSVSIPAGSTLSYPYKANVYGCSGQILLQ